jgi:alkylated DNA repair dioxygenase AlkB
MWSEVKHINFSARYMQMYPKNSKFSQTLLRTIETEIEYLSSEQSQIQVFGRLRNIARKEALYGDEGLTYKFANKSIMTKPWIPILLDIRNKIYNLTGWNFNCVHINKFENGNDTIGFHRDNVRKLDPDAPIATLSLGCTRPMTFKDKTDHESYGFYRRVRPAIRLEDGMLLLLNSPTNSHYLNSIPIRKRIKEPLVILSFKKMSL